MVIEGASVKGMGLGSVSVWVGVKDSVGEERVVLLTEIVEGMSLDRI